MTTPSLTSRSASTGSPDPGRAGPALASDDVVRIDSVLLGRQRTPTERIFHFEHGLIGFPDCRRYALFPTARRELFWLQGVDEPALTFLVVDPFAVVDEFTVELEGESCPTDADPDRLSILAIVTLPRTPDEPATANLQGLVILDAERREGHQVVLPDSPYGVRWPVDLTELRKAS